MSSRHLAILAAILAGLLAAVVWLWPSPPETGGDFTLQSADGPVTLKGLRGKAVIVYFGYTYCPDICPTALAAHAAAINQLLPAEKTQVAVVFISVDPERDTPARLKDYARFYHPSFIGLTGTPAEVKAVANRYGARYFRQPADADGRYTVDHTAESFLVGRDGRFVERLPHANPPEKTVAAIRRILQ